MNGPFDCGVDVGVVVGFDDGVAVGVFVDVALVVVIAVADTVALILAAAVAWTVGVGVEVEGLDVQPATEIKATTSNRTVIAVIGLNCICLFKWRMVA